MAASIFDHPAVLLIILAVGLLRWLIQKAKTEAQKTEPPPTEPIPRGSESQTEEERIRKFLEALGQPAGSPPPKVIRRQYREPQVFPKLPWPTKAPPPLPRTPQIARSKPPPMPIETGTQRVVPIARQPIFEVHDVTRQTSSEPGPQASRTKALTASIRLGTRQDLRTAIVLREIFGPPRSLQPDDLMAGSQTPT